MSGHSAIMDSLREVGYRLTPQRMLIVSLIHDSTGHVTAEELHGRVVEQYPFVDISTVYRTLQLLKKLRLVTETALGRAPPSSSPSWGAPSASSPLPSPWASATASTGTTSPPSPTSRARRRPA